MFQQAPWTPTARKPWAGGSWGHPVVQKKTEVKLKTFDRLILHDCERTAWIFGAGASASKPYQVPVQNKLLERFFEMTRPGGAKLKAEFEGLKTRIEGYCKTVLPGVSCTHPKLSLEEVFSAYELAKKEPRSTLQEAIDADAAIRDLREAIRIATFVYGRGDAKKYQPHGRANVPSPYAELLEKLYPLAAPTSSHVLITFNYDISLDRCAINLRNSKTPIDLDYGIPLANHRTHGAPKFAPPNTHPSVLLLRTHGALNWLRCFACQSVFTTVNRHAAVTEASECWCCGRPRLDYVLVHPSFLRSYSDPIIQIVWGRCQEELVRADRWIFIGYSLPSADVHFRELLRDCLRIRDKALKETKIIVVGRGPLTKDTFDSYEALFEARIEAWNATAEGFSDFVKAIDHDNVIYNQRKFRRG